MSQLTSDQWDAVWKIVDGLLNGDDESTSPAYLAFGDFHTAVVLTFPYKGNADDVKVTGFDEAVGIAIQNARENFWVRYYDGDYHE